MFQKFSPSNFVHALSKRKGKQYHMVYVGGYGGAQKEMYFISYESILNGLLFEINIIKEEKSTGSY